MSQPARPTGRRVPVQRRSLDRLERIARAAGALCGELGADAVTMEAIAARAETSVGSVYQFYPNRDALLQAVGDRYVADLLALLEDEGAGPPPATLPLEALVDAVLEPFVAFHRVHPGYFAVLFAPQSTDALRRVRGRLRTLLTARVDRLFEARAPGVPAAQRRRLALTAVEAARALMQYIEVGVPRGGRAAMRAELRAMLVAYLGPWLGAPPDAPPNDAG